MYMFVFLLLTRILNLNLRYQIFISLESYDSRQRPDTNVVFIQHICTAVHFYMVHKRSIYTMLLYRGTLLRGTQRK